tara:strand:- start:1043 stop:1906 length:864 start_codon:yes stop_codon:yes gene_type:complete
MTKTELANFDSLSKEQIMRLTGQEDDSGGSSSVILSRLAINRMGEDDDGNKVEVGTYKIYDPVSEKIVYSKKNGVVKLRPFIRSYQYMEYNPDENNYSNKSIIFKSWKDEAIDMNGGIKCGKVPFKEIETLSREDQAKQKQIKCYTLVYGLLNMDAVTGDGKEVTIEDLPILWRATGMNFRPINEAITSIKGQDKLQQNTNLLLSTQRKKHGANVYYMTSISLDKDNVEFTKKNYETIEMFNQLITEENKEVVQSWKSAQSDIVHDAESAKVINEVEAESPEKAFAS